MKGLSAPTARTWYTWQVDRGDKVPLGIPQLMMAFTADNRPSAALAECDAEYGISSEKKKRAAPTSPRR